MFCITFHNSDIISIKVASVYAVRDLLQLTVLEIKSHVLTCNTFEYLVSM